MVNVENCRFVKGNWKSVCSITLPFLVLFTTCFHHFLFWRYLNSNTTCFYPTFWFHFQIQMIWQWWFSHRYMSKQNPWCNGFVTNELNLKLCCYNLFVWQGTNQKWSNSEFHQYIVCHVLKTWKCHWRKNLSRNLKERRTLTQNGEWLFITG